MRYPSAEQLRKSPERHELARLEDKVTSLTLAARTAGGEETPAAVVALLLTVAAREAAAHAAERGQAFDEKAFVEAAKAAARWAARRAGAASNELTSV